jgi:peptide/nickel transport system permease protein
MNSTAAPSSAGLDEERNSRFSWLGFRKSLGRIVRYSFVRILTIFLTVAVGIYLTLLIVNLGGFVDEIFEAQIAETIAGMGLAGAFDDIPEEELADHVENLKWQMEEAMGLHEPLALRTARWWWRAVSLQWGESERSWSLDRQSRQVSTLIFERMPYTLLLVGAANVILFFISLGVAMMLSSKRGKFWDRLLVTLTPISSAPSWVHGVILLAIFALELRLLPFKGMFSGAPPEGALEYAVDLMKHMVLPVMAVVLSVFFQSVYTWRTFFIVHSGEDYVELAKAKGLPDRFIRRRYLMRPTLPSIITSFALMLISFWEGAIALEVLFNWTGIGALFFDAVWRIDRPIIVAMVVLFAYILGLSVVLLDVIYALMDPRVRIGQNGASVSKRAVRKRKLWDLFRPRKSTPKRELPRTFFDQQLTERDKQAGVNQLKTTPTGGWFREIFKTAGRRISKYPLALLGLVIILILIVVALVTVVAIPYEEAVAYWHSEGTLMTPKLARPVWTNFFRRENWPESIYLDSTQPTEGVAYTVEEVPLGEELTDIRMNFAFDMTADVFPQDLIIVFDSQYEEKHPFVTLNLITPDGREMEIGSFSVPDRLKYVLSHEDIGLVKNAEIPHVHQFFGDPAADFTRPMKGEYQLQVLAVVFEPESSVALEGAITGEVYGPFGTDALRRDLTIALLWGTPVALTFGVIGAVVTTLTTIGIAAISAWYGGLVDEILQRITELNIILPTLPIAVLVYLLYSKSIWVILGVVILMNIFGNSLKEYRAMFLQFKEAPYIEAAVAYGAPDWRIIFKYMLPRIVQVMVPQLVISVPAFVFLESTLAYLGVVTPYLPTWGKVINMALHRGTFWGHYFWVLEPIILVLITGLAFALVGFALDSILNPRIRDL